MATTKNAIETIRYPICVPEINPNWTTKIPAIMGEGTEI